MKHRPRLTRTQAWLVTGPVARGTAFAVDFATALAKGLGATISGLTRR